MYVVDDRDVRPVPPEYLLGKGFFLAEQHRVESCFVGREGKPADAREQVYVVCHMVS